MSFNWHSLDMGSLVWGALIGFLVAWLIDYVYWRQRPTDRDPAQWVRAADYEAAKKQLTEAQSAIQLAKAGRASVEDLTAAQNKVRELESKLASAPALPSNSNMDALQNEKSELLKRLEAKESALLALESRITPPDREQEVASLRAQLSILSSENENLKNELDARKVEPGAVQADVKELDRLRNDYEALSKEHSELKREALLSKAQSSQSKEPKVAEKQIKAETEPKPAKPITPSASSSFSQFSGIRKDPFEKIDGIGPIFEERLWNAGVFSFAQLATMSPDRIRQIVDPQGKQPIVPEDWIKEAGEFARGDKKL